MGFLPWRLLAQGLKYEDESSLLFIVLLTEREVKERDIYCWLSSSLLISPLPHLAHVPNIFNTHPKLQVNLIQPFLPFPAPHTDLRHLGHI